MFVGADAFVCRIPYEQIESINGFKWESEWKVVVDETTDADGYVLVKR